MKLTLYTALTLSAVTTAVYVVTDDDPIYDNPTVNQNPCLPPINKELAIGMREVSEEETTFYPLAAKYRQTDDELYKVGKANNLWYEQSRWTVLLNENQDNFKMSLNNTKHPERNGFLGIRKMKGPFFRSYYVPVIVSAEEDAVNLELHCTKDKETKDIHTFIKLHKSSYFLGDDVIGFTRFIKSREPTSEVKLYYPKETDYFFIRHSIRNYTPVKYKYNKEESRYEAPGGKKSGKRAAKEKEKNSEKTKRLNEKVEESSADSPQEKEAETDKKSGASKEHSEAKKNSDDEPVTEKKPQDAEEKNNPEKDAVKNIPQQKTQGAEEEKILIDLNQKGGIKALKDAEKTGAKYIWLKVKMDEAKKILDKESSESE